MRLPHCSIAPARLTGSACLRYIQCRLERRLGHTGREKETTMLLWGNVVRLFKRWRAYERTYEELMRLDDRELADINIRRGEIDMIARQSAQSAL